MWRIISELEVGLLMVINWIVRIVLDTLRLLLELAKVILLLFGLIARVFLAFVRVGMPSGGGENKLNAQNTGQIVRLSCRN